MSTSYFFSATDGGGMLFAPFQLLLAARIHVWFYNRYYLNKVALRVLLTTDSSSPSQYSSSIERANMKRSVAAGLSPAVEKERKRHRLLGVDGVAGRRAPLTARPHGAQLHRHRAGTKRRTP